MGKYVKDEIVEGCVSGIENYGIFVTLDEYYNGLIHISEISDDFVRNINDFVNLGETIRVRVIDVNEDEFHVKLSIKNLNYKIKEHINSNIKETEKGFSTLEKKLFEWIDARNVEKN